MEWGNIFVFAQNNYTWRRLYIVTVTMFKDYLIATVTIFENYLIVNLNKLKFLKNSPTPSKSSKSAEILSIG